MNEEIKNINEIVYFYKIVSKDNKYIYVGKTINFHLRLAQHIKASYDTNIKTKIYKIIRDNNYWWNFDMVLLDTKYNITNIEVQETEQYYIDFYNCNLNTNRAKRDNKKYVIKNGDNSNTISINLIKDIINYDYNNNSVKLYYYLLYYLQIDINIDFNKHILKHYIIDNTKKKFLTSFKDILNNTIIIDDKKIKFIDYINQELLKDYNNCCNLKKHKLININILDINKHLREIIKIIKFYLKHINLYIDYGNNIYHQEKVLNSLQFTIQRYNKNIMLNYPPKKVKNINYLQQKQIIIYKDIIEEEVIKNVYNNIIIIRPINNIKRKNLNRKYYDENNKIHSELYNSYNNNECLKKRRFYNKYYNDTTREKVLNFININLKMRTSNKYIKTDYQNQYYNDITFDSFDKMNNVFTELLKNEDDLIIINK